MKRLLFAVLPLSLAWGCEGPTVSFPPLYRAGERLLLIYKTELVAVSRSGKTTDFGSIEIPIQVKAAATPGQLDLALSVNRVVTGHTSRDQRDVHDSDAAQPPLTQADGAFKEWADALKTLQFTATMGEAGEIIRFQGRGEPFKELDRVRDPRDRDLAQRTLASRFRSCLEESLAYLPAQPVPVGKSWLVRRAEVFPLHEFPVGTVTGCAASSEKSTCRLAAIRPRAEGRIAVVTVAGRRDGLPETASPIPTPRAGGPQQAGKPTGSFLESAGELLFNLETGRLVSLQIESRVRFKGGRASDGGVNYTFTDYLVLKPISD